MHGQHANKVQRPQHTDLFLLCFFFVSGGVQEGPIIVLPDNNINSVTLSSIWDRVRFPSSKLLLMFQITTKLFKVSFIKFLPDSHKFFRRFASMSALKKH